MCNADFSLYGHTATGHHVNKIFVYKKLISPFTISKQISCMAPWVNLSFIAVLEHILDNILVNKRATELTVNQIFGSDTIWTIT